MHAVTLCTEILKELHDGVVGGQGKTLSHLMERFYWRGHWSNVRDWCCVCVTFASRLNFIRLRLVIPTYLIRNQEAVTVVNTLAKEFFLLFLTLPVTFKSRQII